MARSATFFRGQGFKALLASAALGALSACAPNLPGATGPAQAPVAAQPPTAPAPITTEELATPDRAATRVALLVPLTGQGSDVGQAMLNAAQIALFDVGDDAFELLPRDTRGSRQGADTAAREAIASGAELIVGPLFSYSVGAVTPIARQAGVPVLAFSNDWTQAGPNTWIMGLAPQEQVERVAGYTRARGMTRFGGLVPRTAYGDAVANALYASADRLGAEVVRLERFDPNVPDVSPAVRSLASAGPAAFEAVLIAEGGDRLRTIAPTLPFFEIDPRNVKLLGTGLWDDASLANEPALVGGWYAAPDPAARSDFEERYAEFYGQRPPRLATLAYDATALAAVLARFGPAGYTLDSLTNPSGFAGVDGIFRLLPGGRVERGLAVLEVAPGGARIVDPAPDSFQPLLQ
ncbi:MAG TPA: penicillin-binding protein activator [Arenibaculum sp.]|nr:penicillin-binding protein activator [Arenibaculum sp.]